MIALRYVILGLSVVGLIGWIAAAVRYKRIWYVLPAFLWLLNTAAFNIARLTIPLSVLPAASLNDWALSIQLQGVLTLVLIGWFIALTRERSP
jgi:hypothetical protein